MHAHIPARARHALHSRTDCAFVAILTVILARPEHVELDTLDDFMTAWLSLVQNHGAAKSLWKNSIGTAMKGYSTIRWCSRHEVHAEFTKGILLFWKTNGKEFPTWSEAMRIVGSFTPRTQLLQSVCSLYSS